MIELPLDSLANGKTNKTFGKSNGKRITRLLTATLQMEKFGLEWKTNLENEWKNLDSLANSYSTNGKRITDRKKFGHPLAC